MKVWNLYVKGGNNPWVILAKSAAEAEEKFLRQKDTQYCDVVKIEVLAEVDLQ
jgi:hypothetical protein